MARSSSATVVLVTLAVVAVLALNNPARSSVARLAAPNAGLLITAVPTAGHGLGLVPAALVTGTLATITQPKRLTSRDVQPTPDPSAEVPMSVQTVRPLTIPGPLVNPGLSLLAGPVDVPLELQIPALEIKAPVLGVGLPLTNAMAAPVGTLPDDPIWQTVFWYRGGGIPGDAGTATFAGHMDDALGRPAVFAFLGDLRTGDVIVVRDERSGLEVPFIVTETKTYTDQEAADPDVLARIFGSRSVSGSQSQSMSDPLSHLTLITCTGAWVNGSFSLRLVVYAVRASYPFGLGT